MRISGPPAFKNKVSTSLNKLNFCRLCFGLMVIFSLSTAWSQEEEVEVIEDISQGVEIVQTPNYSVPYRERRKTHGWLFSVNTDNLYFPEYISALDGLVYEDIFGQTDLTLVQIDVGYKLNFALGAIGLSLAQGLGSIQDDRLGFVRELEISKTSATATLYLDNFMAEPYVVPYIAGTAWRFDLFEQSVTSEYSASTDIGFAYSLGLLFQLNWMDRESAAEAYKSYGLQNTYLDVFFTQHTATASEEDPDFESDFNWGVGLKLEF